MFNIPFIKKPTFGREVGLIIWLISANIERNPGAPGDLLNSMYTDEASRGNFQFYLIYFNNDTLTRPMMRNGSGEIGPPLLERSPGVGF